MHLEKELKQRFGYDSFRSGQKEIIASILNGDHVIGRLPTGSGKSLCYFFLAPHIEGIFLVVSPLVALMEDQVYRLKMEGLKNVAALNGLRTVEEKQEIFASIHRIKYLFLSPEMLQSKSIQVQLKKVKIGLFIVDEAHCISKWGYDFRSDYLRIRNFLFEYPSVQVMALTATATEAVLTDIGKQLGINEAKVILSTMNRSNISIFVERLDDMESKYERLLALLKNLPKPILIYCNRRKTTEELYGRLRDLEVFQFLRKGYFHGGLDAKSKMSLTEQFVTGELDMMICTNAFGMGLHKDDIRAVIHFDPPFQIESYMQEMGRAGRDGALSCSIVLWTDVDFYCNRALLLNEMMEKEQIQTYLYWKYVQRKENRLSNHKVIEYYLDLLLDVLKIERSMKKNAGWIEKNIDFCTEKIYNYIVQRKQLHIAECKYMEDFFRDEDICRRERLLQYFGEKLSERQAHCCDVCGDQISNYDSEYKHVSNQVHTKENWLEKLQSLLLDS